MRVFCDLHHADLYYSLQLLFEKRLGAEMYRPIGLDWYHEKYWHVYPHIDTAKQFLGLDQAVNPPKDIHGNYLSDREQLNKYYRFEDGIYYIRDTTKGKVQRGITLEKFKDVDFDIIISSIPAHINPFNKLIQLYQPKAKHIFQVGNGWGKQPGVSNILASTAPFAVPPSFNVCFYHQEFDLDDFNYESPTVHNRIDSYIHYMQKPELLIQYANTLGYESHTHGAGMEDCFHATSDISDCMKKSGWTWHYKPGGDGYGHILHNSLACGRPLIIQKAFYSGQIADQLLVNEETCVDIGAHNLDYNVSLIKELSEPNTHKDICKKVRKRFDQVVNFDKEEVEIKKFIENLV